MKNIELRYVIATALILFTVLSYGCSIVSVPGAPQPPSTPLTSTTTASNPISPSYTLPKASTSELLPSIAEVVAKVKPSVVAINTEMTAYDIFNRPVSQQGAGSGWILDKNGIIVTNNHVVERATKITVTLDDGRTFKLDASKVSADALSDLAVLKIDASGLPALTVGDSTKMRLGDWVVAIGNALGEGTSATNGIISRLGATIPTDTGETLHDLIQTNAAINPGNSGGPLVNMAGEVIGITSAKFSAVGVEGMGYAISTHAASPIIEGLVQKGYIVRPWLGVSVTTVNQWLIMTQDLAVDSGCFLTEVVANGPAAKAGLSAGDVIVSFDGKDISSDTDFLDALYNSQAGQTVRIIYWRGQAKNSTMATVAETPAPKS
jgi:serine protease Do